MAKEMVSDDLYIPVRWAIFFVFSVVGGIGWLTYQHWISTANAATIVEVKEEKKDLRILIREDVKELHRKVDEIRDLVIKK